MKNNKIKKIGSIIIIIICICIFIEFRYIPVPLSKRTIQDYRNHLIQRYGFDSNKLELVSSNKSYIQFRFSAIVIPTIIKERIPRRAIFRYNYLDITVFDSKGYIEDNYYDIVKK